MICKYTRTQKTHWMFKLPTCKILRNNIGLFWFWWEQYISNKLEQDHVVYRCLPSSFLLMIALRCLRTNEIGGRTLGWGMLSHFCVIWHSSCSYLSYSPFHNAPKCFQLLNTEKAVIWTGAYVALKPVYTFKHGWCRAANFTGTIKVLIKSWTVPLLFSAEGEACLQNKFEIWICPGPF